MEYLDDASLTGFVAEDVVQLGEYYVSTRFGCVTHSKGHDWAEADGILGMGFPAAALRSVPFPLFWALTDETRVSQTQSNVLSNRVFTLMLAEDKGEIVLGGHDPDSVEGAMVTTPVRPSPLADGAEAFMHYMIDVQSFKVGSHELLNFKDSSIAIQVARVPTPPLFSSTLHPSSPLPLFPSPPFPLPSPFAQCLQFNLANRHSLTVPPPATRPFSTLVPHAWSCPTTRSKGGSSNPPSRRFRSILETWTSQPSTLRSRERRLVSLMTTTWSTTR